MSRTTANILAETGADARTIELGEIAGWLHDMGNTLSRKYHGLTGGLLAYNVLIRAGMDPEEAALIANAIGNHEENVGVATTALAAALQLADKSDAHRSRINKTNYDEHDIHDRVNMSIKKNYLVVDTAKQVIRLVIIMSATSAPMGIPSDISAAHGDVRKGPRPSWATRSSWSSTACSSTITKSPRVRLSSCVLRKRSFPLTARIPTTWTSATANKEKT